MPPLTPSRILVLVISFSLFSLLWRWGFQTPLPDPSFPTDRYDGSQRPANEVEVEKPGTQDAQPGVPGFDSDTYKDDWQEETMEGAQKGEGELASSVDAEGVPTPIPIPKPKPESKSPGLVQSASTFGTFTTATSAASAARDTAATSAQSSMVTTPTPMGKPVKKFCKEVHHAPNVMVIVKTSKAELSDKLPVQLKTLLSCVPYFAIFSDHSGEIEGYKIHDIFDQVTIEAKGSHEEFNDYKRIQNEDVKPGSVNKELDKWKILPMVYEAYQMRPHSRFYMFIEADTSLNWSNLLQWVDRLDYRIAYYSGAPTFIDTVKFAQRGPGILLSNGALRQYAKTYEERYAAEWEPRISKECCGDMVLATALTESHVEFYSAFPMLQGESPSSLDWDKKHWCAPMISWHHMEPAALETVWDLHRNWTTHNGWEEPYLHRDAFTEMIEPQLSESKSDWDNISAELKFIKPTNTDPEDVAHKHWNEHSDQAKNSVESPEGCKHACELNEECMQWKHSTRGKGECYLGKVMRLGRRKEPKEDERWTSGWLTQRVKKVTKSWACQEVKWKFNQ